MFFKQELSIYKRDSCKPRVSAVNHLIGTLKLRSNGPLGLYSNTVIGTLAVDGRAWYSEEGPGQLRPPPGPLLAVPNVTAHPVYQLHIIRCGTIITLLIIYLCPLNG